MRRSHPNHQADIPISLSIYNTLGAASMLTGFAKEDWEIAEEAIHEWASRNHPDAIPLNAMQGYQWKSLFLPDGTVLRTVFGGKNYHCRVDNDRIVYDGEAVSPSGFVNAVGGIRRNAWRSIWVLLSTEKEWKLADSLRTRQRATRPRRPARPSRHAPLTQSDAATPASVAQATAPEPDQPQTQAVGAPQALSPDPPAENNDLPPASTLCKRGPQNSPFSTLRSPPSRDGGERRAPRDERLVHMLRAELLPLLHRLCGVPAGFVEQAYGQQAVSDRRPRL
jgi:hypothetical protein